MGHAMAEVGTDREKERRACIAEEHNEETGRRR